MNYSMYYSGGSWHKPQNSHAVLLDKYWTKLQMGNMTREELKKVSVTGFIIIVKVYFLPNLLLVATSNCQQNFLSLRPQHLSLSLHVGPHQQVPEAGGGGRSSPRHLLPADRGETL